jgi:ABC-type antimicrobial peptide transport system permease subunit
MNQHKKNEIKLHHRFLIGYKKHTLAIFSSIVLTFLLLTVMLVLFHTNRKISDIQGQTEFTPAECYIPELSMAQLELLKQNKSIKQISLERSGSPLYKRNNKSLFFHNSDDATITLTSKVLRGRLPKNEQEVVAEKWALLNLGIKPELGYSFIINEEDTGKPMRVQLVGILSDSYGNKKYGLLHLNSGLKKQADGLYTAYLQFKDGVNYEAEIKNIRSELKLEKKQIRENPIRQDQFEAFLLDLEIIGIILFISMVVFYGVYRIATISRQQQYGVLRAIGMKKRQLQAMILAELYQIFLVSAPIGILMGVLLSRFVLLLSGDDKKEVYLNNQVVHFTLVIPAWQIGCCIFITAGIIGIFGILMGRRMLRFSVVDTISGNVNKQKEKRSLFILKGKTSKEMTLLKMGGKYLVKDLKTSAFIALTICLGVILFTGLAYKVQSLKIFREDTRDMYYLNGQYAASVRAFDTVEQGVSRKSALAMQNLSGVTSIKTSSGLPIRVIDEDNRKRNDKYYNEFNQQRKENQGFSEAGFDGKNQIYNSILFGYNLTALEELKKHVLAGDFEPNHMSDDEIIVSVFRTDDTKSNAVPGSYREGTPLMQFQVGDEIKIKYRADLQTDSLEYANFSDTFALYTYKTYKVAAIVSFPYMYNHNLTVYPTLITADQWIKKIAPNSSFQDIYLDSKNNLDLTDEIELEQQLIELGSSNPGVAVRSLISEIEQNEMFYRKQMVYVYGIAIITFILVLINIINNLQFRMQTRIKEISMLRAIGMSIAMTKRMLLLENSILGLSAVFFAFFGSFPVLWYLYKMSDLRAMGHSFQFDFIANGIISVCALVICVILSLYMLRLWKTKKIVEGIGKCD